MTRNFLQNLDEVLFVLVLVESQTCLQVLGLHSAYNH